VRDSYSVELDEFFDVFEVVAQVGHLLLQLEHAHDVGVVHVFFHCGWLLQDRLEVFAGLGLSVFFAEREHQ